MSHESFFDAIFGDGSVFDQVFGRPSNMKFVSAAIKPPVGQASGSEREHYQESLITELLTTLAGKKLLTNEEARDVIRKAKERAKTKAKESSSKVKVVMNEAHDETGGAGDDAPCGGSCPIHDRRPHKRLECARCQKVTPHLVEDDNARCRVCVTARPAS